MTADTGGNAAFPGAAERLEALYRHFNDEVRWLFSNRVIEALARIGDRDVAQFLALNLPELVLNIDAVSRDAHTFGQRAMARFLAGRDHLAKGLQLAIDDLNIVRDAEGEIVSYHSRTMTQPRCKVIYDCLCELLWQFDDAGGEQFNISSTAFGLPSRQR